MEAWIAAETRTLGVRLKDCLQDLGIVVADNHLIDLARAPYTQLPNQPCDGVVFVAVATVGAAELQQLHRLHQATTAKLVVVADVDRQDRLVELFRHGASDLLTWQQDLPRQIHQLFRRVNSQSVRRSEGRIVTIIPSSSPCDSSLLAANLAALICHSTEDCGLVDLDLRGGDLATMLKLDPPHTLHDLLTQRDGLDETMIKQALACHGSGVRLLASPKMFSPLEQVRAPLCRQVLQYMRATTPCTVIHANDVAHAAQLGALKYSDAVLLTTQLDIVAIARVKEVLRYLADHQLAQNNLSVVAMRTGHCSQLPVRAVCKLLDLPAMHCVADDAEAITASLNVGNPLVQEYPQSPFTASLKNLLGQVPPLQSLLPVVDAPDTESHLEALRAWCQSFWSRGKNESAAALPAGV